MTNPNSAHQNGEHLTESKPVELSNDIPSTPSPKQVKWNLEQDGSASDTSPKKDVIAQEEGKKSDTSTTKHEFEDKHFPKPTFCQFCDGFIWGLGKQGLQCKNCGCCIHKRCLSKLPPNGCGNKLKEPTLSQLEEAKRTFAREMDDNSFPMFSPSNQTEEFVMQQQIEDRILQDIHKKHTKESPKVFNLHDIFPMLNDAASMIVEDEFTNCFQSQQSRPWNWNIYLFPAWIMGILLRYFILVPLRVSCLLCGSFVVGIAMALSWLIKNPKKRQQIQIAIIQLYSKVFIASWSGVIRYHGVRPQKRPNQIFVANHTTVFDIVILMQDFAFSIVGQKHPGIIGFMQKYVLDSIDCLWFDRKDSEDRAKIAQLIKEHVHNPNKLPLLLFPEGTCVNNEYCVMFKKGAFEIENSTVWPIAIKYNKLFSDPFWNSRQQSIVRHLFRLLSGWAVVADVWYLEPQTIRPGESAAEFADRVKAMIAKKAGLVNVPWDGYLKYFKPSERFVEERRKIFASSIISRFSSLNLVQLEKSFLDHSSDSDGHDHHHHNKGQSLIHRSKSLPAAQ